MDLTDLKVAYLCLKGGLHPAHRPWVEALLNVANAQVINLSRRFPFRFLSSSIYRRRYDLAIADGFSSLPVGWFMKRNGLCRKLAFITTSASFIRFPRLSSNMLRDVDLIITTSTLMSLVIKKLFNFNHQVVICYPIPDLSDFNEIEPSLKSKRICFVGHQTPIKGVDLLPGIMAKVRRRIKDAEIYVIGKGNIVNESEGIRVLGYVPRGKVLLLLPKCSIYLHPARFEAFGLSVVEAMAAGLIPIVTEMTGSKDLVKKVDPSLVVPVDVDTISEKVIEVLSMRIDKKEALSRTAKHVAAEWSAKSKEIFLRRIAEAF